MPCLCGADDCKACRGPNAGEYPCQVCGRLVDDPEDAYNVVCEECEDERDDDCDIPPGPVVHRPCHVCETATALRINIMGGPAFGLETFWLCAPCIARVRSAL